MPRFPFLTISLSLVKLCLWRQWCYPAISSSVVPCPHSFSVSKSFPMSHLIASSGQSIGASASVLPMNIQRWFPLELTGLISLLSKRLSRVFLWHHNSKASILWRSALLMVQLSHLYMTAGKTIVLPIWTFVSKLMSLLLNTLSRCVAEERICELEERTEKKI